MKKTKSFSFFVFAFAFASASASASLWYKSLSWGNGQVGHFIPSPSSIFFPHIEGGGVYVQSWRDDPMIGLEVAQTQPPRVKCSKHPTCLPGWPSPGFDWWNWFVPESIQRPWPWLGALICLSIYLIYHVLPLNPIWTTLCRSSSHMQLPAWKKFQPQQFLRFTISGSEKMTAISRYDHFCGLSCSTILPENEHCETHQVRELGWHGGLQMLAPFLSVWCLSPRSALLSLATTRSRSPGLRPPVSRIAVAVAVAATMARACWDH